MAAKDTAQALKDLLQAQVAPAQAMLDQLMAEVEAEKVLPPPSDSEALAALQAALDAKTLEAQASADLAVKLQADLDALKAVVKEDVAKLASDVG